MITTFDLLTRYADGQAILMSKPALFLHPDPAKSRGKLVSLTGLTLEKFGPVALQSIDLSSKDAHALRIDVALSTFFLN
jgi:hypothetical protein